MLVSAYGKPNQLYDYIRPLALSLPPTHPSPLLCVFTEHWPEDMCSLLILFLNCSLDSLGSLEMDVILSPCPQWLEQCQRPCRPSISICWNSSQVVIIWGFPAGSDGKESTCNAGDPGSIPGLGRSPGEENGNTIQCSCLGNLMDGGAWWATVHDVAESDMTEQLGPFF